MSGDPSLAAPAAAGVDPDAGVPGQPCAEPAPDTRAVALPEMPSGPLAVQSIALTGIFVMMVFYTLHFAKPVLMPITAALLISMLLTPAVTALSKLRIPAPVGAAIVVLGMLSVVGTGAFLLADPAQRWMERAPYDLSALEVRLREFKKPIKQLQEATSKVEQIADVDGKSTAAPKVSVERESVSESFLVGTPRALGGLLTLVILLYFWLAGGDSFLRKLVRLLPRLQDKKRAVDTVRTIQSDISRYLLTITLINATLGLVTGCALWLMDVPNAALWGALAGTLNFMPFLGAAISAAMLAFVGLLTFTDLSQALAVPGVFLVFSILEGSAITPMILGERLALSPMAIFVSLMVFGWMWGIPGALIAVPLLASIKIICERIESLHSIAAILSR